MTSRGDESWRLRAECRPGSGYHPETWFPYTRPRRYGTHAELRAHRRQTEELIKKAKAICGTCPVARECLAWAVDNDETEGIWGGKTPKERGVKQLR